MLGPDGTPLVRQYICPRENKVLQGDDIVRGYEVDEGKFVVITDDELRKLAPRSSRDIELTRFVDRDSVDPSFFERSYFLLPGAGQSKAYRLLAETMESTNRAGVANFVMRGKGYAVAIFAESGILRAETLRFGDEVRTPADVGLPEPVKPKAAAVRRLKSALSGLQKDEIDEKELEDDSVERILELAEKKHREGQDVIEASETPEEPEAETQVIDLMKELQRRLNEKPAESSRTARKGSTKSAGGRKAASTRSDQRRKSGRRAASKPSQGSG